MALMKFTKVFLHQPWMQFDLIDYRILIKLIKHSLQVVDVEIAHTQ